MTQRFPTIVLAAGLLLLLGGATPTPPAAHAQSAPVTTQRWIAFPSTAFLNGETVGFSGAVHLVVHAYPVDPALPPNPVRIHTNPVDIVGIGETTGTTYRVTGSTQHQFELGPPNTYAFQAVYPVIREESTPGDPHRFVIAVNYQVQVNADGTVGDVSAVIGRVPGVGD